MHFTGGGFVDLIQNQLAADLLADLEGNETILLSPFNWGIVGKNITFLTLEIAVFFMLNLAWEFFSESWLLEDNENLLTLDKVYKKYHSLGNATIAVKDMNMKVSRGECVGLIGLNGAGKSTTFQMIVGKIRPTSGSIHQSGQRIGYCPQANSLDLKITVNNLLHVYSTMCGFNREESAITVRNLLHAFGLEVYANVPCGELSGGNKRKVCTAISTIGSPDSILMDEPTSGMDPKSRRLIWARVREYIRAGDCTEI
jgi:ABC-type multidrug transport system ATPase subunit